MTASLLAQYAVITLAVLLSAGYVAQRQWPQALRTARIRCAVPLLREGRAGWLQRIGRVIAPAPQAADGDGCGGCNGCEAGTARH